MFINNNQRPDGHSSIMTMLYNKLQQVHSISPFPEHMAFTFSITLASIREQTYANMFPIPNTNKRYYYTNGIWKGISRARLMPAHRAISSACLLRFRESIGVKNVHFNRQRVSSSSVASHQRRVPLQDTAATSGFSARPPRQQERRGKCPRIKVKQTPFQFVFFLDRLRL